jgi:hypothetical protein
MSKFPELLLATSLTMAVACSGDTIDEGIVRIEEDTELLSGPNAIGDKNTSTVMLEAGRAVTAVCFFESATPGVDSIYVADFSETYAEGYAFVSTKDGSEITDNFSSSPLELAETLQVCDTDTLHSKRPIEALSRNIAKQEYGYDDPRVRSVVTNLRDLTFTICDIQKDEAMVSLQDGDVNGLSVVVCFPENDAPYSDSSVG